MVTHREEQAHGIHEFMRGGAKQVGITTLSARQPERVKLYAQLTLEPGASIGYHRHDGETELIYVLDGCGHVRDDDKSYDICPGDCTVTMSGHSHGIENMGENDLILLSTIVRD